MFGSSQRVAFYIGNYPVMKYGITMGAAIAVSFFVLIKIKRRFYSEINEERIIDLSFWLIICGIIGARFWYVILNIKYFYKNMLEIFMIHHGGISVQGAIIGGIIGGLIYVKKHNLPFLKTADLYSYVLPIGQAIGRWGNFFNSEAFGFPCDLPWKLFIPIESRPLEYRNYEFFHPAFLYESILDLVIFILLFYIFRRLFNKADGAIFFTYLILYSVVRIFTEGIRIDSVMNIGNMPIAMIISIIFIIGGVIGLKKIYSKS